MYWLIQYRGVVDGINTQWYLRDTIYSSLDLASEALAKIDKEMNSVCVVAEYRLLECKVVFSTS